MYWTDPFFLAQIIQVVLVVVLFKGIATTIKALRRMEDRYSRALVLILLSLITYVILAVVFSLLLYRQTDYGNYLWTLPSIIGLAAAIILVLGGKKLFSAISSEE